MLVFRKISEVSGTSSGRFRNAGVVSSCLHVLV